MIWRHGVTPLPPLLMQSWPERKPTAWRDVDHPRGDACSHARINRAHKMCARIACWARCRIEAQLGRCSVAPSARPRPGAISAPAKWRSISYHTATMSQIPSRKLLRHDAEAHLPPARRPSVTYAALPEPRPAPAITQSARRPPFTLCRLQIAFRQYKVRANARLSSVTADMVMLFTFARAARSLLPSQPRFPEPQK
jgi:hypothetical protein